MGRLIDAARLKSHYSWWGEDDDRKRLFDEIIDQQPTVATVTNCRDCRFYGQKYHRCSLFSTDKAPEGYCDEGMGRETT